MHLGDRGGRDRPLLEAGEQRLDRAAKLALDCGAGGGAVEGRQPVLQLGEVGRQLLAEEVGAGREELAELDERRAELVERPGKLLSGPSLDVAARAQARHPEQARRHLQDLERGQRVVSGQGAGDGEQPENGADRAQHGVYGI
jgi:hypothetical protein